MAILAVVVLWRTGAWHGGEAGPRVEVARTASEPPALGAATGSLAEAPQGALPSAEESAPPAAPVGVEPLAEATALKREAMTVAGRIAEAFPDDALAQALMGSAAYNTGQSTEAIRHLKRCLELNPNQADAYEILARIAYEKGEMEEAVRLGRESLARGPANPDLLNQLGRSLMDSGQTEEAVRVLRQAVALPRPVSESDYLLGQAYQQAGEFGQARESFLRAVAAQPDHTQAYFGLFTACTRLGRADEAARYRQRFQELEAVDRRSLVDRSAQEDTRTGLPLVRQTVARTLFGAGQVHRLHGQGEEAVALFRRAASLDAEQPLYRAALEVSYVRANALAEGVKAFEGLVREQPGSALNHLFLGRLQGRLRQFEAAEAAFRKVQELAPDRPEGYRALGELYLQADLKPDEARRLAGKAVELEPSAANYHLLAGTCLKKGDRAGAVEAMKQAVALDPKEPRYRELLQQLQAAP